MREVVKVNLENEMDLILGHKRAMKLCELCGLSLISQTSIATAVSEIARCAIEYGKNAVLTFGILMVGNRKQLKVVISDSIDFSSKCSAASNYAKRLVDEIEIINTAKEFSIILKHNLSFQGILTESKIQTFVDYFQNEPPLSPYDELRRKNILLQDLAEKIKESESDYRTLTDSLPLMMFSVNSRGVITYANKWLSDFLGSTPKELSPASWQSFIAQADFLSFSKDLGNSVQKQQPLNGQYKFRNKASGNFVWHLMSVIPLKNDKEFVTRWIGFIVDIHLQKQIEQTLKDNRELKRTQEQLFANQAELQQKIVELNRSNYELEQFAHLATHDLQEPLRKLFYYSDVLQKKYASSIDTSVVKVLDNMARSAGRMKELITDLLSYSQMQKQKLTFEDIELNEVVAEVIKDLDLMIREKNAVITSSPLPRIQANPLRIRQLFSNLLSNSMKYCRKEVTPVINISVTNQTSGIQIIIQDNGIGFEEAHKERIFGLFERLHTRDQFPGTGIGLSICRKITELHQGAISANSILNEGSTFYIDLPYSQ